MIVNFASNNGKRMMQEADVINQFHRLSNELLYTDWLKQVMWLTTFNQSTLQVLYFCFWHWLLYSMHKQILAWHSEAT